MAPDIETGRSANGAQGVACLRHAVHEPSWYAQRDIDHTCSSMRLTILPGGINLVVYFVPSALHKNVGLSENLALVIGGCVQTMFFFGSLIPTFFLDRLGRRNPMMWGSAGCGVSMMLIAVMLSFSRPQYSQHLKHATASASVTWFFTYMFIFGASANCIPWVYVPGKIAFS